MATTEIIEEKESQLKKAVSDTINHIAENPEAGEATFSVRSTLEQGFRAAVQARDLQFVVDEPENLGGDNEAPNPVEYVLGALAACQEIVIKTHANQLGIDLESVEVSVEGDIDLKGFFALSGARPGFKNVSYQTEIKTDEKDSEKLQRLKELSLENCPVLDIIQHSTPVEGAVNFTN